MQYPGFWIARDSFADKIILDQTGVSAFNSKTENDLGLIKDLLRIDPVYSGKDLIFSLRNNLDGFAKQKLYLKDLREAGAVFYQEAEKQINFAAIPAQVNARYGFVCKYADQRLLPTDEILTSIPGDLAFDELQNSSLDIGTPLVILHESKDRLWAYTQSPTSSGWIKKDNLVFCEFSDFKSFLEKRSFVVVVSAKADIFQDPALTRYIGRVRMGAKFLSAGNSNSGIVKVIIPSQGKNGKFIEQEAYLKKTDVNLGYLTYTPRNIIQQAFKLLNAPYSWGGKSGEQDCSGFIQEVFYTVGITLPRNSSEQGKVGRLLSSLNKQAIGGVTILQLKGHILLYLGMYAGRHYAIHDIHTYTQKQWWGGFSVRKLNRVVVSDLSLGEGSKKGSLFQRIVFIRNIES
ncbi:MAG: SH3 domain-containing protein [Candidatus Omnitrophota bacterium]